MMTKKCKACGAERPASLDFFAPRKQVKSGLGPTCIACQSSSSAAVRAKKRAATRGGRTVGSRHSAADFRARLDYNPSTGVLLWKARPGESFETQRWNTRYAGKPAGSPNSWGYILFTVDGLSYKAHLVVWTIVTGKWPSSLIDHRDGNKANNSWENLRQANAVQNNRNRRPRSEVNPTGRVGVFLLNSGKYSAKIRVDGRSISLGSRRVFEQAVKLRETAELKYFGEFAPCLQEKRQ